MRRSFVLAVLFASLAGLASCGGPELVAPQMVVEVHGAGRVVSVPAGIDCPGDCTAYFPEGAAVSLIPEAEGNAESCIFVDAPEGADLCGGACNEACFLRMGLDQRVVVDFTVAD